MKVRELIEILSKLDNPELELRFASKHHIQKPGEVKYNINNDCYYLYEDI